MAVVSDAGVIGVVAKSGKNYASVISILNLKYGLNAKIKRTGFFGELKWDGNDYRYVYLYDIPVYSSVYIGDEIVTTGFSIVFPEGIAIGTVESFEKEQQSSFYQIKVKLNQDFKNLENVYVIDFNGKEEIKQIIDTTMKIYEFDYKNLNSIK
jgi:rod shape-determining protein MreC